MRVTKEQLEQLINEEYERAVSKRNRSRSLNEMVGSPQSLREMFKLINFAKRFSKLDPATQRDFEKLTFDPAEANVAPDAFDHMTKMLGGFSSEIDHAFDAYRQYAGLDQENKPLDFSRMPEGRDLTESDDPTQCLDCGAPLPTGDDVPCSFLCPDCDALNADELEAMNRADDQRVRMYKRGMPEGRSRDAAFKEGDWVVSTVNTQGLQKGKTYVVVDVLQKSMPFGNFVTYVVSPEYDDEKLIKVTNGHVVLEPAPVDQNFDIR